MVGKKLIDAATLVHDKRPYFFSYFVPSVLQTFRPDQETPSPDSTLNARTDQSRKRTYNKAKALLNVDTRLLIARLARSDPRNHFVVVNFLSAVCSNLGVFRHLMI